VDSYIGRCVSRLRSGGDARTDAPQELISPKIYEAVRATLEVRAEYGSLLSNPSLLYGFLLHLRNVLRRLENNVRIQASAVIVTLWCFRAPVVRRVLEHVPLPGMIGVQVLRVAGGALVMVHHEDLLPDYFALLPDFFSTISISTS
jgi:hypothetical protein